MKQSAKAVNFFSTVVKSGTTIPSSGSSGTLEIASKTVNGFTVVDGEYKFFVIVSGEDESKREIFRVWKVVDTVLHFDRRISPVGAYAHSSGETVQVNDVAEMVNYAFEIMDDFGKVDDAGGLALRVAGGRVQVGETSTMVASANLTATDNMVGQTVVFDTGALAFSVLGSGVSASGDQMVLASVTTSGGDISSLTDARPAVYVGASNNPGTVTAQTSYGLAADDGDSSSYARADHVHGTPDVPTAAQLNGASDGVARGIKDGAWVAVVEPGGSSSTPVASGSTVSDMGTYWKVTSSDGAYVEYKEDGIYHRDSLGNLIAYEAKTGTYSASGMTYADGSSVGSDGSVTADETNPAFVDKYNEFQKGNTFKENVVFAKSVYGLAVTNASNTIDFSQGNVQILALSGAGNALVFQKLSQGTTFALFVNADSGATIGSITCTDTGGNPLATYCVGGTLPNVSAGGTFCLPIFVGQSAAHVFVNGPTLAV